MMQLSSKTRKRNALILGSSRNRRHSRKEDSASWAVSYVDMLTLLLCFFIIFYNIKPKTTVVGKPLQSIVYAIQKHSGLATGTEAAPADALYKPVIETLKTKIASIASVEGQVVNETLVVNFKDISFFDTASTQLRPEALAVIEDVVAALKPAMNSIHITVQGHTDSRSVVNKRTKFEDNWELSVLRATSVLKHFAGAGFPQETLSAEGFASSRGIAS